MVALHERPGVQQRKLDRDKTIQIAHEKDLMRKARVDLNAFGEIFESYYPKVVSYFQRTDNLDIAEDVTSIAFEKALKAIHTFNPNKTTVSGWLFRIAINSLIDLKRREKTMRSTQEIEAILSVHDLGEPEKTLEIKETMRSVAAGFSQLSANQKRAVELRLNTDFSNRKIAEALGLSEGAVKSLLFRAWEKIGNSVENEEKVNL